MSIVLENYGIYQIWERNRSSCSHSSRKSPVYFKYGLLFQSKTTL